MDRILPLSINVLLDVKFHASLLSVKCFMKFTLQSNPFILLFILIIFLILSSHLSFLLIFVEYFLSLIKFFIVFTFILIFLIQFMIVNICLEEPIRFILIKIFPRLTIIHPYSFLWLTNWFLHPFDKVCSHKVKFN